MQGKDRLIVALDVPTHDDALRLVDALPNISFFKVGLELFLRGDLIGLLQKLQKRRRNEGGVFVDLKLSGDIGNTIASLVRQCQSLSVKFLTLSETVPFAATLATLHAARDAREGGDPKLLMVPFLSSLDQSDLAAGGETDDVETYILKRSRKLLESGCDGLIVSGQAIRACRLAFGANVVLVSPGIRPDWSGADEQKRHTTPAEAIRLGSDYLVVGRPITRSTDPRGSAQKVLDEIDAALAEQGSSGESSDTPKLRSA